MSIVYLNGEFIPAADASISPLDRGFIFADGVYEVIPVFHGRLFRLEDHLQRLDLSLAGIKIKQPFNHGQWKEILTELVDKNGGGNLSLYLQVTRGVAPRDHAFPIDTPPTIFAMVTALKPLSPEIVRHGVAAVTLEDIRWKFCNIKSIALLPNILLRQQAIENGATEAILIREGKVTEGAASNVFIVTANRLITPPKGPGLLPGITRDLVLELAKNHDIAVQEAEISLFDLQNADEIWLTSSTREIIPVTSLDGKPVKSGIPGPLWIRVSQIYQQYKQDIIDLRETA